MRTYLSRRVLVPLGNLLRQGLSAEKLALSAAVGLTIGVFPVLGSTTLLCALAALCFRLNPPALQIANYLVFSLQLVLLIPLIRLGEFLYGARPLPLSLQQIQELVRNDYWQALSVLAGSILHATTAWLLLAPLAVYAAYRILLPLIRRLEDWRCHRPVADSLERNEA